MTEFTPTMTTKEFLYLTLSMMCGLKRTLTVRREFDNERHKKLFEAMTTRTSRHPEGSLEKLIAS